MSTAKAYTISGTLKSGYSVFVSTSEATTLTLNNVTISSTSTAALAQFGSGKLTVSIPADSTVTLSDGGDDSEFDACLFSNGPLEITGSGKLVVTRKQDDGEGIATEAQDFTVSGSVMIIVTSADDGFNAGGDGGTITISGGYSLIQASGDGVDSNKNAIISGGVLYTSSPITSSNAAIDTDDGYTITKGTVIATMGSNMPESPVSASTQNCLCLGLGMLYSLIQQEQLLLHSKLWQILRL